MSHEIRTPLHGILGLTGVLVKTTLSRSQHDYLRLLGESAEHLLNGAERRADHRPPRRGQAAARSHPFCPRGAAAGLRVPAAPPRPGKGPAPAHRKAPARRPGARRRAPPAPGAAQPGQQRHQVHRNRHRSPALPGGARPPPALRARGHGVAAVHGERHRPGHCPRNPGQNLRALHPGHRQHRPRVRRLGPGPEHFGRPGEAHGRRAAGVQRNGPGQHVCLHPGLPAGGRRPPGGAGSAGRGASPGRCRPHAAGRRQPGEQPAGRNRAAQLGLAGNHRRQWPGRH